MSAFISEGTQFVDTGGQPLVGGFVYIGLVNADPKISPITIFSDRELTVTLANPQTLDASGRTVNKIWIPATYSLKVEDLNNVQVFQELDNGEDVGSQTLPLTNVLGTNAITADATPTITSLTDKAEFILQIVAENSADAVTLAIDGTAAKAIKRNFDQDVGKGKFKVGQTVKVVYNLGVDNYQWTNENARVVFRTKGADIASAATIDLSSVTGNFIHITGNTGPITSFGTFALAGVDFFLIYDSNPTVNHSATLLMPNASNRQMAAGYGMWVHTEGSNVFRVVDIMPADGTDYPPGFIDGLQLAKNGTDATNDIDVPIGSCRAENIDVNMDLTTLLTKQIDANWVVGSGNGGFPSGLTLTNDTLYNFFLIKRTDTGVVDAGFDTSLTATNLLADATNYDAFRKIGSVYRSTAANSEPASINQKLGGAELLTIAEAFASPTIDLTSFIDSTYKMYRLDVINAVPASDDDEAWLRVSEDGGSTFKAGATDYGHSSSGSFDGVGNDTGSVDADKILLTDDAATNSVGSTAGESFSAEIYITNPSESALRKLIRAAVVYIDAGDRLWVVSVAGRYKGTTNAIDGIRFLFETGNITSGLFKLYGIR